MQKTVLIFFIILFSCENQSPIPLEHEVKLNFNTAVTFEDGSKSITMKITSIQDNRCPADANCVRAGEAIVTIAINNSLETICLDCTEGMTIPSSFKSEGRTFTIIEVNPFPYLAQPSTQEDKIVTLQVD